MAVNKNIGGGIRLPPLVPTRATMFFGGLHLEGHAAPKYPFWMYRDDVEPLMVRNASEEKEARLNGYDNISSTALSNKYLINWVWDLEDMSPKQLRVFASEEYRVDLPIEASQETMFKAVCELTRHAPQNRNRLILMAHTVAMNYDATLEEIKRMVTHSSPELESETISFEVEL